MNIYFLSFEVIVYNFNFKINMTLNLNFKKILFVHILLTYMYKCICLFLLDVSLTENSFSAFLFYIWKRNTGEKKWTYYRGKYMLLVL